MGWLGFASDPESTALYDLRVFEHDLALIQAVIW
jgi:hypothetical protein